MQNDVAFWCHLQAAGVVYLWAAQILYAGIYTILILWLFARVYSQISEFPSLLHSHIAAILCHQPERFFCVHVADYLVPSSTLCSTS